MKQLEVEKQEKNKLIKCNALECFGFEPSFPIARFENKGDLVPEIDQNYHFNQEICHALLAAFSFNRKTLITGLHGSGKSTHIEQVAARLNREVLRINLDGQISRADLLGRDVIKLENGKQVTKFQEGLLVYALKRPITLILDEYDAAKAEVMFTIQRLLENDGKLTLLETGEVITPHREFRIFATSNTIGAGDEHGIYHGVSYINQGQLDRWQQILRLNYICPEEELNLLQAKFPNLKVDLISDLIVLANFLRNAFFKEEISQIFSLRTMINTLENYQIYENLELSFRYNFYNRCDDLEQKIVVELYQRVFAKEL